MEKKFFSEIEALSRAEIKQLQLKRLREQVEYLGRKSPYYKRVFRENKITPEDFRSLDDLKRLPFIDKYMVGKSQDNYPPFGEFLCVPEGDIVKYFRTSGTTFTPRNFAYTWEDWWDISVEVTARMRYSVGVRKEDRVFIAFPYNTFIALWTMHYACEKIGCMVIPGGGASTKERLNLMKNLKVTVLCGTPTYAYRLANVAEEEDMNIRSIPLRAIITGGEALSAVPGSRKRLEELWKAKAYEEYGASEAFTPLGSECIEQSGLHFTEDIVIPEILNKAGEPVAPGEQGELVVSNIKSKTMPMLRFKTGDVLTYVDEPCACGRESIRVKVIGRTDDMLVIKGTNVFPTMIEEMVKRCPELGNEFMIVIDEINDVYELVIQVEPRGKEKFTIEQEEAAKKKLVEMTRENLRMRPVVQVVEPGSLPRFESKSKRVVDKRPKSK